MSMQLVRPTNDRTRTLWLETAGTQARTDAASGRSWLTSALRNQLDRLVTDYSVTTTARNVLLAARRKAVAERAAAVARLEMLTRQAFRAVLNLARRGDIEPADLDRYTIPSDRRFPFPYKLDEKVMVAKILLEGNTRAVAAGLPPFPDPNPEVLQAALDLAEATGATAAAAKEAVRQNTEERREQETRLIKYWRSAGRQLRDALADLPPAARREQMRRYGYTFTGTVAPSETVET